MSFLTKLNDSRCKIICFPVLLQVGSTGAERALKLLEATGGFVTTTLCFMPALANFAFMYEAQYSLL